MHFHLLLFQRVMCESKQNVQGDSSSWVWHTLGAARREKSWHRVTLWLFQTATEGLDKPFIHQAMAPDCWKAPGCCGLLQHGMHVAHRACLWSWWQQTRWQVRLWLSCPWGWWWRQNAAPTGKGCQSCQFQNFALTKHEKEKKKINPTTKCCCCYRMLIFKTGQPQKMGKVKFKTKPGLEYHMLGFLKKQRKLLSPRICTGQSCVCSVFEPPGDQPSVHPECSLSAWAGSDWWSRQHTAWFLGEQVAAAKLAVETNLLVNP